MALLKGKQAEITFKRVELNESNQKNTQKYVDKLNEILEYRRALDAKKNVAASQVKGIQEELETLNANYVIELDNDKIKEMDAKRRELKEQISNLMLLVNTDFKRIIKEKINAQEVKDLSTAAQAESNEYDRQVDEAVLRLTEEIERLEQSKAEHLIAMSNNSTFAVEKVE